MAVAKPAMKVAAICGSLRKASCNRGILRCAVELCNESIEGMQIEIVDISALPFVNTDLEVDGTYPPAVEEFRRTILEADSILFGFPEYNYSLPGIRDKCHGGQLWRLGRFWKWLKEKRWLELVAPSAQLRRARDKGLWTKILVMFKLAIEEAIREGGYNMMREQLGASIFRSKLIYIYFLVQVHG